MFRSVPWSVLGGASLSRLSVSRAGLVGPMLCDLGEA
jgi:hypothetical protein